MPVFHKHMTQRVPSDPYWKFNCAAYCLAMLIHDSTLGGVIITGRTVRKESNEPVPDPGSPGLNLPQLGRVADDLHIPFYNRTGDRWASVKSHVGSGNARAILSVDYDVLQNRGASCQREGSFDHAILLVRFVGEHVIASDPLCADERTYRAGDLKAAAEKFGSDHGMVGGGLYFATSRPVPRIQ